MKTKWGTAKVDSHSGYYQITSRKEGNNAKKLHRLIYEDEFGKIPEGGIIHHIDGNKLNNNIKNLQCINESFHHYLHSRGENNAMYGRKLSEDHIKRIIEVNTGKNNSQYNHDLSNKRIYDLYFKKGLSMQKIAKKLNTNRKTISRRIKMINEGVVRI